MTTTTISAEEYREALKAVIDPEIFHNIVDLGLVYNVLVERHSDNSEVARDVVTVTMTLTTPHCPMGPQIMQDVEQVLRTEGAAVVKIDLVWQPVWTPDAMTDELKQELGMFDEEPSLVIDPTPPVPKKKSWLQRLFGG